MALLVFLGPGLRPAPAAEITVAGITEPFRTLTISAPVPGVIVRLAVEEGDTVKAGAPLVELDRKIEILEVERRKLIWQDTTELQAARERLATLGRLLEASRDLYQENQSVSGDDLARQELEYTLARIEEQRLAAEEKRQEVEYRMAREEAARRRITAPRAGTIARLYHHQGEAVREYEPLLQLVDTSQGLLVCNLEVGQARFLASGQQVSLRLQGPDSPLAAEGTVVLVSPVVDPASGLRRVKIRFDNHDGAVIPGTSGELLLEVPDAAGPPTPAATP